METGQLAKFAEDNFFHNVLLFLLDCNSAVTFYWVIIHLLLPDVAETSGDDDACCG